MVDLPLAATGSFPEALAEAAALTDTSLGRLLAVPEGPEARVFEAMRYSALAPGKRLRPFLVLASAQLFSVAQRSALQAAAAVELIHAYSLVHDDLPAMDDSDLRRGRPTCHKQFDEATAVLAGDALLTLAFEVLSKMDHTDATRRIELVRELASASGTVDGMIGGQVNDIEGEGKHPTARLLESIHRAKTGALLRASVRMGGIYAGANADQLDALTSFGEHVGLAFQMVDDILDVEQSSEALGKTAGKDAAQKKITFPAVYGIERSREMAEEERLAAHLALQPFDDRAQRLRQLADLVVRRQA